MRGSEELSAYVILYSTAYFLLYLLAFAASIPHFATHERDLEILGPQDPGASAGKQVLWNHLFLPPPSMGLRHRILGDHS